MSFNLFKDRRRSGTESKTAREKEGGSKKELPVKARLGGTIILFSRHIFLFFSFLVRFRQDGGDFPQIFHAANVRTSKKRRKKKYSDDNLKKKKKKKIPPKILKKKKKKKKKKK